MTIKVKSARAIFTIALLFALAPMASSSNRNSYQKKVEKWRAEKEAELKSDGGWLTVAGLFWLKEGVNRFGADASNEIVLPEGSAPAKAGEFEFHGGKTTLRVEQGVAATSNGKPVTTMELKADAKQKPDIVNIGGLSLYVIKRGERYGVRVKDKISKQRREFTGMRWFDIKESYRIKAAFVRYDKPKEIEIPNILGDINKMPSPGYVTFKLDGKEYRLDPILEAGDPLFFRCTFTQFATCPLPPRQNRLRVAIEAGELNYHSTSQHKTPDGR